MGVGLITALSFIAATLYQVFLRRCIKVARRSYFLKFDVFKTFLMTTFIICKVFENRFKHLLQKTEWRRTS